METRSGKKKGSIFWDLVLLDPLAEETLLRTLYFRFKNDHFSTYIGNELVVVNPFKDMNIYTKEIALGYLLKAPFQLPPHVFSIISSAYRWLINGAEDQCILLFGESGSGKTEIFKIMLNFLSFVVRYPDFQLTIENGVKSANVILDAFGNAETVLSSNSSRFCKFLTVEFDFRGDPFSASFMSYFLDKDRITYQSFGERNFHIFYQILFGADVSLLKTLKLSRSIPKYTILKHGKLVLDSTEDRQNFFLTKKAMESLNFSRELIVNIFKIISSIMKLGNLNFISTTNIDGTEGCSISNEHEMYDICSLLGIDPAIFQKVSTHRKVYILQKSGTIISLFTEMVAEEASYARDSTCRTLYGRLFTWLVKTINTNIKLEPRHRRQHLSFFDMFGFEKFKNNGFHQFIVNYSNETVFHAVIDRNIRAEYEEYIREGIDWPLPDVSGRFLPFNCNKKVYEEIFVSLDHLSSDVVSETSLKLTSISSSICSQATHSNTRPLDCFKLRHYAGEVLYNITDFPRRSNDTVSKDVSIMMFQSSHPLLKILFSEGSIEMAAFKVQPIPPSKQVKISLDSILRNFHSQKLYYIRCIKPNHMNVPHVFESALVLDQVRTQRIIETVRFRRNGFSFSLPHSQFLKRYKILSLKTWPSSRLSDIESIQYLVHDLPIPSAEFVFGSTRIFVRSPRSVYELEDYRCQRLNDIAAIIQSKWRSYHQRKLFIKMKHSQTVVAVAWKLYKKRKQIRCIDGKREIRRAVEIIQKRYIQWRRYQFLKRIIDALNPFTMSPVNQDWPSCHIRFAETSSLLRKLHHKWRCQKYRSSFSQSARNKMREKVTASYLFKGKKNCYAESVSKPFVGDYVRLRQDHRWKRMCRSGNDERVVFADVVNKIARTSGRLLPALLVLSTNSVLMMDQRTLDIKYRIPASEIYSISVSPFEDNIAMIHIYSNDKNLSSSSDVSQCFSSTSSAKVQSTCFFSADYYEKGDIIFQTNHVIEVVTKLFLVVQNMVGRPPDVIISSSFNALFHQQIVNVSFRFVAWTISNKQSDWIRIVRKGNTMEITLIKDFRILKD